MILVDIQQTKSVNEIPVYNIYDFPYEKFENVQRVEHGKRSYFNIECAFDIETTTIRESECGIFHSDFGFMYIWQFCIGDTVCIGRTWDEYKEFLYHLKESMGVNYRTKLVVYSHNLQFEFQFMRNFFEVESVFARHTRDVLYVVIEDIEYRCSYALSNMSLDKFLKNSKGVDAFKLSGDDFNYRIKRYPDTPLSKQELAYCIVDVYGLCQAIRSRLEEDDLCTIPLTSTGYIRREFREVCLAEDGYKRHMKAMRLDAHTYALCVEACRGGISGSNNINTGWTIDYVDSFDIKSSYPYQMATKYFPQSRFLPINVPNNFNEEWLDYFLNSKCCLIVWECEHLKLKKWESIPYISKAKCRAIERGEHGRYGNGKVYSAARVGMCCTEIDFKIIRESYDFDNLKIHELWIAERGMLSKAFRTKLMSMFQMKTNLEDGDKYLYAKFKNKINASFGMMLTDILNAEVIYDPRDDEPWKVDEIADVDKGLNKYYNSRNSFLSYQHGVWVTAHARASLYEGMKIVGDDIVQVDTDSVKAIGEYKKQFDALNDRIRAEAETFDVKPYAIKDGHKVYLGIWEHENDGHGVTYERFKSLGAKKYMYQESGSKEVHTTVSGLRKGAISWLMEHGGFRAFAPGTTVPPIESGRTASKYVDLRSPKTIILHGHEITLGSSIGVIDVGYTFGVTDEWREMIYDEADT